MSNEKYCVKEGYVLRQLAGEFLAVPVSEEATENGKIIILNPVSHFIWQLIETEKAFDEILDAVTENFDVAKQEAQSDIKEFLDGLKEAGLLQ